MDLFLFWLNPLFKTARKRLLVESDVPLLPEYCSSSRNGELLDKAWIKEQSLPTALFQCYGLRFSLLGLLLGVSSILSFAGPVLLDLLVECAEKDCSYKTIGYLTAALTLSRALVAILSCQYSYHSGILSVAVSSGLKDCIFRKTLRLSTDSRRIYTGGNITNYYTVDIERVVSAAVALNNIWIFPIQIILAMVLLLEVVSFSMFAGLLSIIIILVANHFTSTLQKYANDATMDQKDKRMKLTSEVFGAMLIVRLNAWEDNFQQRILDIREKELLYIWRSLWIAAINICLLWMAPCIVSVSTIIVYTKVLGNNMTASKIFTALALFRMLQDPLRGLPNLITQLYQALTSAERLQLFQNLSEKRYFHDESDEISTIISEGTIQFAKPMKFKWNDRDLILICGPVGSGKSSFCSMLLGDMYNADGSIKKYMAGSSSYASQQAWIQHMSIRDNILFGCTYDAVKYERVVDSCCLWRDFATFPSGDRTVVGEKGLSLSGGQRSRIALARAVYSDASIIILDDVLAALDAVVARDVFDKCIVKLLSGKTRLLVTHNQDYLLRPEVDAYISTENGSLNYRRLTAPIDCLDRIVQSIVSVPYDSVVKNNEIVDISSFDLESEPEMDHPISSSLFNSFRKLTKNFSFAGRNWHDDDNENANSPLSSYNRVKSVESNVDHNSNCLDEAEERAQGRIDSKTLSVGSDLFLSSWTRQSDNQQDHHLNSNILIYSFLSLSAGSIVFVRSITVSYAGYNAAKSMFEKMLNSLMHAPMNWLDKNPSGRLLNRMGDDQAKVDTNLPFALGSVFATGFSLGGDVVAVTFINKEIQRMQSLSQSPVLTCMSEVCDGLSVIRAFGASTLDCIVIRNQDLINRNACMIYLSSSAASCHSTGVMSSGLVGLSLSYGLSVSNSLQGLVLMLSWFENSMVCPERIQQYIDVEPEGTNQQKLLYRDEDSSLQLTNNDITISKTWPSRGEIEYRKVRFRYQPTGEVILRDLSFKLSGGEKVGIVGRTGSGKSTIAMSLLRIAELSSGAVLIDGIDCSMISLKDLRSSIEIVPQNPVLFKGSLRCYLDPFNEYTDLQISEALDKAQLRSKFLMLSNNSSSLISSCLEFELAENGNNLSVGERQMLVLSRAILRGSKILLMDEATANVDYLQDKIIQDVIRKEFKSSTVLTIAHRIDTIMSCDRVLVLSSGELKEFDSPQKLLMNKDSQFYSLAIEALGEDYIRTYLSPEKTG
eukprot:gene17141-22655_t